MDLLTIKETAQILRVSPITVRRYIASGELPAQRAGRGIRVRRQDLEDFLEPIMPSGKPFAIDDPLWNIVGIGESEVPSDVGSNKHKVLANAIEASWSDESINGAVDNEGESLPTILEALGISIGIGRSGEPTNIAEHKDEYLADAFEAKG